MNSVKKVPFRGQKETLPKPKFLRVNQQLKTEIKTKKYNKTTHLKHTYYRDEHKKPQKVGNKR